VTDLLDRDAPAPTTRPRMPLLLGGLVVLALLAGGIWWFFLRDDAPDAFDIEDAVAGALDTDDAQTGDDPPSPDTAPEGVEGTWTVGPGTGPSAAGFRVAEELASIGATEAVGRTEQVTGSLTIDGATVTDVSITVDMDSLRTDDARRDGRMRSSLATDEFPTATFVLTRPIDLDSIPAEGETISVTAVGDMTIKGVTNPVEVALDAQVVDDTLVVVGSLPVVFADYGVVPPSAAIVVSIEDRGTVEFQLYLARS